MKNKKKPKNFSKNSPKFKDVSEKIFKITKDKIIVAHNVDFDYRVIKNEFQSINIKYYRDSLCTVDLSKLIFPNLKSYKLTNLLSNFGIENENPHRANSDALGALKLFQIICDPLVHRFQMIRRSSQKGYEFRKIRTVHVSRGFPKLFTPPHI